MERRHVLQVVKEVTGITLRNGLKTGWVFIEGIWVPIDWMLEYQEGAKNLKRKIAAASVPALIPGAVAVTTMVSKDLNTGLYVGGIAWWAEGVVFSAAQNFICPPSERLLRRKIVSLGKAVVYHPCRFLKLP